MFLSPDAIQGYSAYYADARFMSVCLSVRLSHAGILSKRLNISSNFFSPSVSHTILVFFRTKQYPLRRGPPTWARNQDFRPISGFGIDDFWSVECSQQLRPCSKVHHSRHWRQSPRVSEPCLWQQRFDVITARRVCIARTMLWQDVCLSVRPSVCRSVTRRYSVDTAKHIR